MFARRVLPVSKGLQLNGTAVSSFRSCVAKAWTPELPDAIVASQLPTSSRGASRVLVQGFPDFEIFVGAAMGSRRPLSIELPGNGGMRVLNYKTREESIEAAVGLAQGMEVKHAVYNTGFAGAKVVVNAKSNDVIKDKGALMASAAKVLNELGGAMYTGCDINTTIADMDNLSSQSPFVLAGITNAKVNPNKATALGVFGALEAAAIAKCGSIRQGRFFVHGCGQVGATVARELIAAGAKSVHVCDIVPDAAAAIDGAVNMSEAVAAAGADWAASLPEHDIFVPCSTSHIIDTKAAMDLPAGAIVGAANLPFASTEAQSVFAARDGFFVPEGITSAGAVILDSIEHFDRDAFGMSEPSLIYSFCQEAVRDKTNEAMALAETLKQPVATVLPNMIGTAKPNDTKVGHAFRAWSARATASPTFRPAAVE